MPTMAKTITSRIRAANWVPIPTSAERNIKLRGGRNTSPWTSFHPDSSLTSLSYKGNINLSNNGVGKPTKSSENISLAIKYTVKQ
jgi:hypothetical protein